MIPDIPILAKELVVLIRERLLETPPAFHPESDLYEHGLDSMAIMQLLLLIEEKYGVLLPDADLTKENFHTPLALAHLIHRCSVST